MTDNTISSQFDYDDISTTWQGLLECIAEIIVILDVDYTIRFVNQSFITLLDYEPIAILNHHFSELVHPEESAVVEQHLSQLVAGQCQPQPLRVRLRHHDGSWRIFELRLCNRQQHHGINGIVLSGYDVTPLLAADYALRSHDVRYRQLLELAPMMIIISSLPDGVIRYCNPAGARIFGVTTPEELLNRPLTEFLSADEHAITPLCGNAGRHYATVNHCPPCAITSMPVIMWCVQLRYRGF